MFPGPVFPTGISAVRRVREFTNPVLSRFCAVSRASTEPAATSVPGRHAKLGPAIANPSPRAAMPTIPKVPLEDADHTVMQPPDDPEKTQLLARGHESTLLLSDEAAENVDRRAPVDVNTVLLGRFKLAQLVGEGGMSDVYKAIDLRKVEAGAPRPASRGQSAHGALRRFLQLARGHAPGGEQAADADASRTSCGCSTAIATARRSS